MTLGRLVDSVAARRTGGDAAELSTPTREESGSASKIFVVANIRHAAMGQARDGASGLTPVEEVGPPAVNLTS